MPAASASLSGRKICNAERRHSALQVLHPDADTEDAATCQLLHGIVTKNLGLHNFKLNRRLDWCLLTLCYDVLGMGSREAIAVAYATDFAKAEVFAGFPAISGFCLSQKHAQKTRDECKVVEYLQAIVSKATGLILAQVYVMHARRLP